MTVPLKLWMTISASESNEDCREVISGAWRDFHNPNLFNKGLDLMVYIIAHPTAEWAAQQIAEVFPWDTTPKNLMRDRGSSYGSVFGIDVHCL